MTNEERRKLENDISVLQARRKAYLDRLAFKQQVETEPPVKTGRIITSGRVCLDPVNLSGEKRLFYETHMDKIFESTIEDVLLAEYHLNRNFTLRGHCLLNEFYEFLGLPPTEYGNTVGWEYSLGWSFYGYQWIDFTHEVIKLDDGLEVIQIGFLFEPTEDCVNG